MKVLGKLDHLNALCVGYEQLDQLHAALSEAGPGIRVDANFIARTPDLLQREDRPAGNGGLVKQRALSAASRRPPSLK